MLRHRRGHEFWAYHTGKGKLSRYMYALTSQSRHRPTQRKSPTVTPLREHEKKALASLFPWRLHQINFDWLSSNTTTSHHRLARSSGQHWGPDLGGTQPGTAASTSGASSRLHAHQLRRRNRPCTPRTVCTCATGRWTTTRSHSDGTIERVSMRHRID